MNPVLPKNNPKYIPEITDKFGTSGLKIDLGCGNRKRADYIGLDIRDYPPVDICDATVLIPLPASSVAHVYSYHTLEHITTENLWRVFHELARVTAPGAVLDLWVPYWTHFTAYNLSHTTRLNEYTFMESSFTQYFEVDHFEFTYEDEFKGLSQPMKDLARRHLMNVVKEVRVIAKTRNK